MISEGVREAEEVFNGAITAAGGGAAIGKRIRIGPKPLAAELRDQSFVSERVPSLMSYRDYPDER